MKPKKIFRLSLKSTLLISVAVLVIASGVIISQIVTHRYSVSLLSGAVARAENIAHKLALDVADKILINDMVAIQKLLDDQVKSDPEVGYLFIVKGGQLLTHTFSGGVPINLLFANAPVDSERGHLEKIISDRGNRFLDVAWPVFGGKAGTLRLGLSEAPYRRQVRQLWLQMSLITAGILIFALIATHFIIHRLTRPLVELTNFAEEIDEGRLETEVEVHGRAEINKLAAAFNSMITRLKDYTQRLVQTNQQLEQKNTELDRAHHQLTTSFAISQRIAALSTLQDICTYLIKTLKTIVECRDMGILVLSPSDKTAFFALENRIRPIDEENFAPVYEVLKPLDAITFMGRDMIGGIPLPDHPKASSRVAAFRFGFHDQLLGAMLIACPESCRCVKKELDVIELILNQAAGALHRAVLHEEEIRGLQSRTKAAAGFSGIIGRDTRMQDIFKLIEEVAPTDTSVLIQGESGTGKELVAHAIHDLSLRKDKPFVVINCSAYPATLLESEIFGHERGAFTGAMRQKAGRFEQADGGTVFLDEIGEIPPSAQVKLLRVLQSHKFERLGGEKTLSVDIRILAATNRDLLQEVKNGNFREDLFYRLNVIPISLPPLNKRTNDIHLLGKHFLARFSAEQRKNVHGFSTDAMRQLLDYPWPGNVRELENTIEHATVLAKGDLIEVHDLPPSLRDAVVAEKTSSLGSPVAGTLQESEITLLQKALEASDWNKKLAARRLGISRATLYNKLKKYNISKPTLH